MLFLLCRDLLYINSTMASRVLFQSVRYFALHNIYSAISLNQAIERRRPHASMWHGLSF